MSGTMIVGTLFRADIALTAVVAAANIKTGSLPENAPLPSILLRSVSLVDQKTLRRRGSDRVTERVAATVRAENEREKTAIFKLMRSAAAGKTGTIAEYTACSVLPAGAGPDLTGPNASHERTQDFKVSYIEPA